MPRCQATNCFPWRWPTVGQNHKAPMARFVITGHFLSSHVTVISRRSVRRLNTMYSFFSSPRAATVLRLSVH
jgi:hypothetical protein